MRKLSILALLIVQITVARSAPVSENLELAKQVVDTMVDRPKITDTMTRAMAAQSGKFSEQAHLTKEEANQLRAVFEKTTQENICDLFVQKYARIYAATFSKDQLVEMMGFFKSEAGKAYLAKESDLRREFMSCLNSSSKEVGEMVALKLKKEFPEISTKIGQSHGNNPNESPRERVIGRDSVRFREVPGFITPYA